MPARENRSSSPYRPITPARRPDPVVAFETGAADFGTMDRAKALGKNCYAVFDAATATAPGRFAAAGD